MEANITNALLMFAMLSLSFKPRLNTVMSPVWHVLHHLSFETYQLLFAMPGPLCFQLGPVILNSCRLQHV